MHIIVYSYIFVFFLFLVSCGSTTTGVRKTEIVSSTRENPSTKAASITPKEKVVVKYENAIDVIDSKSVFGNYLAQDAVWLETHQLFVNQEFDFSIALSSPSIGAGIAAQKRQEANKKVGEQLALIPAVNLRQIFETSLLKCEDRRQGPFYMTVSLYGLLFGDKKARLQSMLEIVQLTDHKDHDDKQEFAPIRFVHVSGQKALTGEGSWTSDNGAALVRAMRIGTEELVSQFYEYRKSAKALSSSRAVGNPIAKCPVGGNQQVMGEIINKRNKRTILRLDKPQLTLLSCDSASVVPSSSSESPIVSRPSQGFGGCRQCASFEAPSR